MVKQISLDWYLVGRYNDTAPRKKEGPNPDKLSSTRNTPTVYDASKARCWEVLGDMLNPPRTTLSVQFEAVHPAHQQYAKKKTVSFAIYYLLELVVGWLVAGWLLF
jgi:hypothetical protein